MSSLLCCLLMAAKRYQTHYLVPSSGHLEFCSPSLHWHWKRFTTDPQTCRPRKGPCGHLISIQVLATQHAFTMVTASYSHFQSLQSASDKQSSEGSSRRLQMWSCDIALTDCADLFHDHGQCKLGAVTCFVLWLYHLAMELSIPTVVGERGLPEL